MTSSVFHLRTSFSLCCKASGRVFSSRPSEGDEGPACFERISIPVLMRELPSLGHIKCIHVDSTWPNGRSWSPFTASLDNMIENKLSGFGWNLRRGEGRD